MKKALMIAIAIVLVFALAACGSGKKEAENAQIANPWSEAASAEAAAEGAGVGYFQLPEDGMETEGGPVNWSAYRYMKGLAQADGGIGAAELTVRKGLKQDSTDVSGDYTEYKYSWTEDLDGTEIKCWGNEDGKMMKAVWLSDNFSYSVMVRGQGDLYDTYGLDTDTTLKLVGEIQ